MLATFGGGSSRGFGQGIGGGEFDGPIGWFAGTNSYLTTASRTVNSTNPMTYIRSRTNDFNVLTTNSNSKATAYDPITHDLWGFASGTNVQHWEYDSATDTYGNYNALTSPVSNTAYNEASVWALGGYVGYVLNNGNCNVYKKGGSGTNTSLIYLGTLSTFNTQEESLAQIGYFGVYNGYTSGNIFRLDPTNDNTIINNNAGSFAMQSQAGGDGAAWIDMKSSDRVMYSGHNATDQIKMARWNGSSVSFSTAAASNTHFGNDWADNHMGGKISIFNPSQTPNGSYNAGDIYSGYYGWLGCRGYSEIVDRGYGLNGNWQSRSAAATHGAQVIYCPYHKEWRIMVTTNNDDRTGTNSIVNISVSSSNASLNGGTSTALPSNRTVYMSNRGTASTSGNYHPQTGGIVGA